MWARIGSLFKSSLTAVRVVGGGGESGGACGYALAASRLSNLST